MALNMGPDPVTEIDERFFMNKQQQDIANVVLQLKTVCEEYMLPLQDIGFNGGIGITSVHGVEITNRLLSEDNGDANYQRILKASYGQ